MNGGNTDLLELVEYKSRSAAYTTQS